jgi:hypothetical protein
LTGVELDNEEEENDEEDEEKKNSSKTFGKMGRINLQQRLNQHTVTKNI